jgi:dTDP-4-dehydrorhamnose reductase
MTKVLIFGAQGQLGRALKANAWPRGWVPTFVHRGQCDLNDFAAIRAVIWGHKPDLIINAAAYTAVDKAESEPDVAWAVNTLAPAAMAEAAAAIGTALVQVSSDYVFSGSLGPAWTEDDITRPLNIYGKTKVACELAIRAALPRHLIVRTAWLYDPSAENFVVAMLRQGLSSARVSVVNDQFGRPTAASNLAWGIIRAAKVALAADDHWGTYHLTNDGPAVMRTGFAEAIFKAAAGWYGRIPAIEPISSSDYPSAALRPANSVLDTTKAKAALGVSLPSWEDTLRLSLAQPAPGLNARPIPALPPFARIFSSRWPVYAA